jgi:uncharacterized damage-inducible protein DinB
MRHFFEDYLERLEDLHRDLKQAISGLSVEALDWLPGPDMNSLCVLIVHVTGAERYWIGEMVGEIPANRDRDSEFRARGLDEAALKQRLDDNLSLARRVLEKLTFDDLTTERRSPLQDRAFSKGWALLHALEHTALHTGHAQITRQMWDQRQ